MLRKKVFFAFSAAIFVFASIFTNIPFASATVTATNTTQDGDITNFARQGDIATIFIEPLLDKKGSFSADGDFEEKYDSHHSTWKAAYTKPETIVMGGQTPLPGSFSYTFANAATLQDGSSADVKITYSNITISTNGAEGNTYEGDTYLVRQNGIISLSNSSTTKSLHFGAQMDITVEVVGASGTFYFTAFGINVTRTGNKNYTGIAGNDNNTVNGEIVGWNERVDFQSNNIFVPSTFNENTLLTDNTDTGRVTIAGGGGSDDNYTTGFAALADSSHTSLTSWASSGGFYSKPPIYNEIKIRVMPGNITRKFTSSSGTGGRVDTNKEGTITTPQSALTKAGSSGKDVLSVPNGKEVTYTITPDDCHILDTLTVDGATVTPTPVKDNNGKILYYTYTIPADNAEHAIHATWQKSVNINVTKTWVDFDNAYSSRPDSISVQLKQNGAALGAPVTLSNAEQWKHTYYDLPKYSSGTTEYAYTLEETLPDTSPYVYEESHSHIVNTNKPCTIDHTITNTLKTAPLTLTKQVEGDMADSSQPFDFTITLGGGTQSHHVSQSANDTPSVFQVPIGARWSITEAEAEGYTTSYTDSTGTHDGMTASGTMAGDGEDVTFTNTYFMPPATGMMPTQQGWIVILALSAVGTLLATLVAAHRVASLRTYQQTDTPRR